MLPWINEFLRTERLPANYRQTIESVHIPLADRIALFAEAAPDRMLTVGLCGPQGSGKSTLVISLKALLESRGLSVAVFSLDDLYLTQAERVALSREVHPLFLTRGVPGTHDVALGMAVFSGLRNADITWLPLFDKSRDDRRPWEKWAPVRGPVQVLLFEGWCMGARPQSGHALNVPVNALERDEDPQGNWRRYANAALAGPYQALFNRIDLLVLLRAPDFDAVYRWRLEQEDKLRERVGAEGGNTARLMSPAQVRRFISHYERLTNHILEEMPARADVVLPCRS